MFNKGAQSLSNISSNSVVSIDLSLNDAYKNSSTCIVEEVDDTKKQHGCFEETTDYLKHTAETIFKKKTLYKRVPVLTWLPKYNRSDFTGDLVAGITVGLTVIPQALAFAGIIGIPPQYGLYSCFLGCFVYIIFGSSKVVPVAPTAITSLVTFQIARGSWERVVLFTFLTGLIELSMGIFNLGFLIDFLSGPVSAGFTSAVSMIIFTSQMRDLLVVNADGDTFVEMWRSVIDDIDNVNWNDAALGTTCIAFLLITRQMAYIKIGPKDNPTPWQKFLKNVIWFISTSRNALLVCGTTAIAYYLSSDGKEEPFRLVGHIPAGMPKFQLPPFSITTSTNGTNGEISEVTYSFGELVDSFGLYLIVIPLITILQNMTVIQALSDGKPGDATQEMFAMGLCNIANSFVQGFRSNCCIARAAVLNASGSRTPLSSLYTGSLVIIALIYFTPTFYFIPKAALAAIIIAAVLFTVQYRVIKPIWHSKKIDLIPGLTTFFACLVLSLETGVLVGVIINIGFILYQAARPKLSVEKLSTSSGANYLMLTPDRSLIFPSVEFVRNAVNKQGRKSTLPVVIDCTYIYGADFTAAKVISTLISDFQSRNQKLYFYNLQSSVAQVFEGLNKNLVTFYDREAMEAELSSSGNSLKL